MSDNVSDLQREQAIRGRLAKATPWPWVADPITRGRILGPVIGYGRKTRHVAVVELGNDAACGDPDCCQDSPHVSIEPSDVALIANAPADLSFLLARVETLTQERDAAKQRVVAMEDALHPFGEYAICRAAMPLHGLDDVIHAIHTGSPWESELRLSHCRRAARLLGYDATKLKAAASPAPASVDALSVETEVKP